MCFTVFRCVSLCFTETQFLQKIGPAYVPLAQGVSVDGQPHSSLLDFGSDSL